jgi:hypothetical protein
LRSDLAVARLDDRRVLNGIFRAASHRRASEEIPKALLAVHDLRELVAAVWIVF